MKHPVPRRRLPSNAAAAHGRKAFVTCQPAPVSVATEVIAFLYGITNAFGLKEEGDEAILRGAAAQHCQTPNDPEREEPGSPSDARRTQQQPNSSSSGSGAHTILMVGAGGESGVNR